MCQIDHISPLTKPFAQNFSPARHQTEAAFLNSIQSAFSQTNLLEHTCRLSIRKPESNLDAPTNHAPNLLRSGLQSQGTFFSQISSRAHKIHMRYP